MISKKFGYFAAVASILAVVVVFSFRFTSKPSSISLESARTQSSVAPVAVSSSVESLAGRGESQSVAPELSAATGARSISLANQLALSRDWRGFALKAIDNPEQGGRFYASYVASLCTRDTSRIESELKRMAAETIATKSTVSIAQLAAAERIMVACSSFAPGEAEALRIRAISLNAADSRDPLLYGHSLLQKARSQKGDSKAFRDAASALILAGDPVLLSWNDSLVTLMAINPKAAVAGGLYFDGHVYTPGSLEYGEAVLAAQLGACSDQPSCELDSALLLRCATGGVCAESREAFVREEIATIENVEDSFKRILNLSKRIASSVRSGNTAAFAGSP
jgi:hypothetical protein